MTAEDYLRMPDKIMLYDYVDPKVLALYRDFEREQVLELINSDEPISCSSSVE